MFRPAVCRKDTFTDVLIEASNAGLSREQSVGVCPKRARNDKEGSRADIVAAYTQAVETARPDAMVIVGTDRSAVNDPAMFSFNADFAADLQSPVLLAVCTIERTPEQVKSTVEASTKVIEDAGSKVVGVFITGCDDTQPDPLKACFVDYPVPVWTLPAVDFNDDDAISKADEAFATNVDAAELTAVLESPFDAPTTPYAFQYGLLGKAKADKKTIVLPEGNEDRIIKAADYLLERDIVDLIIVGDENAILARGQELGLKSLGKAKFQAKDDETVLEPMVAKLCELRAKKGMTEEQARKQLADDSYFGTMLVVMGMADGLVSGSVNSTANTVRPALQVIKTKPGTSLVSGAFLMCFKDHVAVFADCAINLNPNAEQLAEIAIQSAETAKAFGLEPRWACCPIPRWAPEKDPTSTSSRKPPPSSKTRLPTLRWSDRSSSTRHGLRPWPRPKPRAIRWRAMSMCSYSRICARATSHTRRYSVPRERPPSGRCCRVSTAR